MQLLPPIPTRPVLLVVSDQNDTITSWLRSARHSVEVVSCPTPEAGWSALMSGRRFSAVVVGEPDPELASAAARTGTPVVSLGRFSHPGQLALGVPVPRGDQLGAEWPLASDRQSSSALAQRPTGRLIALCGPGGTGTSSVAAALAATAWPLAGLGTRGGRSASRRSCAAGAPSPASPAVGGGLSTTYGAAIAGGDERSPAYPAGTAGVGGGRARVLLADFARRADQAFLHGLAEPVSGLLDLVDAGRFRPIAAMDARRHTVAVPGCRLLPGLRRPGHWTAVSPSAFDTVLAGLMSSFDLVLADVTGDFEGESATGSLDVEERNHMARRTTAGADVVVMVGGPGPHGTHRLTSVVDELLDHGVDPARIQPVVNRVVTGPNGPDLAHLCGLPARPVGLPVGNTALDRQAVEPLARALASRLAALDRPDQQAAPVRVTPGSLGCAAS